MDESLGMRRGKESSKKQTYKDRRDESRGMNSKKKGVSGDKYVAANEMFEKAQKNMQRKEMTTPGIAVELIIASNDEGYSKQPRVKPEKKNRKPVSGQKKIRNR